MSATSYTALAHALVDLSKEAGAAILKHYHPALHVTYKEDGSPLSQADLDSHHLIVERLRALTPHIPIISEEAIPAPSTSPTLFWLVDPLDGTKEFINRNGEFTTNIALIENGMPILGVVYAPAKKLLYLGAHHWGAFKQDNNGPFTPITMRHPMHNNIKVVGSRSHGQNDETSDWLKGYIINDFLPVGSSLKFCYLAEGKADFYPRLGRTMEWDTAAGHAILLAAGGEIYVKGQTVLRYGKPQFKNPHFCAKAKNISPC